MAVEELQAVMTRNQKVLHRYPKVMSKRLISNSKMIMEKYSGQVQKVWTEEGLTTRVLQQRFQEFDGIGSKKASMAVNVLTDYYGFQIQGRNGIDVSFDRQVRRVFVRAGLVDQDRERDVVEIARKLNPSYPAQLDYPSWMIGNKFCHIRYPECDKCPWARVVREC